MNPSYLNTLRRRYAGKGKDHIGAFDHLRERYRQFKATSLMDAAAVASTLTIDTLHTRTLDPLALKAIHDTNPTFDPSVNYTDAQWMGFTNAAKGKYFEYLVVDRLNHGQAVGDVVLPDGYTAELAKSMTQPGWDIKIVDAHGRTDEYLQLKATESTSYIHHALDTYPDITILTTHDAAQHMPNNSMVLDSHISEKDIDVAIGAQMGDNHDGFLDNFWDSFHPIIPLLLIASTQGYRIAVGKQTVSSAAEVAKARAARSLSAAAVGALVKSIGGGWLSIPAALLTHWVFDRSQNIDDLIKTTREQNRILALRAKFYSSLAVENH